MSNTPSTELRYVLNACKNIYQPSPSSPDLTETKIQDVEELRKIIKLAKDNALVYQITKNNPSLMSEVKDPDIERLIQDESATYENYLSRLKVSLSDANSILGEGAFLVIKTIYSYPRTTKDIDLLVTDVPASLNAFVAKGYRHSFTEPPYKETVIKKGGLSITLHQRVAWGKVIPTELKFIWESPRKIEFHGLSLLKPSAEADLATMLAHIPFELLYFNLGDVLYMFDLSKLADLPKIIAQAKVNDWGRTLQDIISMLNGLHMSMYGSPSPFEKVIPTRRDVKAEFPVPCPLWVILRAHVEKRAWEKILSLRYYVKKRSSVPKYVETYPSAKKRIAVRGLLRKMRIQSCSYYDSRHINPQILDPQGRIG